MRIRILALSLLMTLAAPAVALGGGSEVVLDYEGQWTAFAPLGFSLFLPLGWETEPLPLGTGRLCAPPDGSGLLQVELHLARDLTLEQVLSAFSAAEGYENVRLVTVNSLPFVTYRVPEEDLLGAVALSAEGQYLCFFKFSPGSDAMAGLALQILSSLTPLP